MKTNFVSLLIWLGITLLGAAAIGGIALNRGESINALWFITAALCVYAIAYRFYAAWIAATIFLCQEKTYFRMSAGASMVWVLNPQSSFEMQAPTVLIGATIS